ncbi:TlpA family protein disulfide reductase [Flavobacterium akiainvivens]|uniref:TlpA family protein disulfide reductase n=1 Tax=Flavobacterium akiainvivens TaxID=1202724 RepID=UPI0006C8D429|nr:TlpA disulfide reductase family protein [Flavobacterium akiainvivens]SFQ45420.1 Thiol-disulfide isomerase or thioredoxin [Flavobacterium akiainvivens]
MKKLTFVFAAIVALTTAAHAQTKSFKEILAENKGKVILVDFWASWCGPCMEEMPAMKKIHDKYKDKDVAFIYLSYDANAEKWKAAAKKLGFIDEKHSFMTSDLSESEVLKALNIKSIPRHLIFDKTGTLVNPDAPRPSDGVLDRELDKYLE